MVTDFKGLRVYQAAMQASMEIYRVSEEWPREERYGMTDQVRRSSRSVCANIGEAWFKRRYPKHFASKLTDAMSEAAETIVWLDLAYRCDYLEPSRREDLEQTYRAIIAGLVHMTSHLESWCAIPKPTDS